ncbi:helix-turn-helix domain-containing protein [Lacticaseibacillus paracasei]|uniref:helix-turn-helix domain-containing protein n=1 Tax=Lacticaseibacillus paracasei TaxID=1597 RepID=UPI002101ADC7|nr:helix-turn-helix domain-containing protein [Lacticaseibacillus paracasei]
MKIDQQHPNGTIMNAIKTYDELADDEKARIDLPFGDTIEDYSTYRVRRNKKNELRSVVGANYSSKRKAEIARRANEPNIVDAMNVLYGKGKQKAEAVAKYRASGIDEKQVEAVFNPVRKNNLLDAYLEQQGITRYQVAKQSGIAETTLMNAAKKSRAIDINTKIIIAIAKTLQKEPGDVLNELIMTEAHRDEAGDQE